MAVKLTLSEQQAALLVPLLQQIAETSTSTNIKPCEGGAADNEGSYEGKAAESLVLSKVDITPQSAQMEPLNDSSSKLCSSYSASDLLQKKKKNTKSTEAQNCLHVRKLANACTANL